MNAKQLTEVLRKHAMWLRGEDGGKRADLSWANLSRANLSGANLSRADLSWANLSRANLSRANLPGADLSLANLSRANLSGANLSRADFSGANLSGCDGATCAAASWSGHGESGRQLLAVRIGKEDVYFCGCFEGSADDLQKYITKGAEQYRASRQRVFDFVRGCMEATP